MALVDSSFLVLPIRANQLDSKLQNKTLEDLAIELRRIEPPAFPEIETITVEDGKQIIIVRVNRERGTYTYDGRPYLR